MKIKIKDIDLDELFPNPNITSKDTTEILRNSCAVKGGGGGGGEDFEPVILEQPRWSRWKTLKYKMSKSIANSSCAGEEFKWVEASLANPSYLRLGLFSASFQGDNGPHQIVFRRYVNVSPEPSREHEYWELFPREAKIPYWEIRSENFSTWTDEGICSLVKLKLERMYRTEVENVL